MFGNLETMMSLGNDFLLRGFLGCGHKVVHKRGGGHSQKNWVGVCGLLPKTLTLFMTKIYDIPYPIYDLTKNSKPHL